VLGTPAGVARLGPRRTHDARRPGRGGVEGRTRSGRGRGGPRGPRALARAVAPGFLHPGILLGVCCGAGTSAPALAAVQEVAKSKVPTLAYGVTHTVGNVLLALWGSVIVALRGTG
jgi:hypothetical protein